MNDLVFRLLTFFDFCYRNNFDYGVCFFENEFHVTVTFNGNIISSGQQKTLTLALDECGNGFNKVGM